jgi:hypothetical protein
MYWIFYAKGRLSCIASSLAEIGVAMLGVGYARAAVWV